MAAASVYDASGLQVLLLEKGPPLPHDGSTLDNQRVVTRGEFLSKEAWLDGKGNAICPEEHFNLGGKTKWYGAAVLRYSPREFEPGLRRILDRLSTVDQAIREATHFDGFASAAYLKGDAQESFLRRVQNSPNLCIRTNTEVLNLLPAGPMGAAAAGALHSPRLLARFLAANADSAKRPPLPAVGRNLKKHVLTALIAVSWSRQTDLLRKTMLTTHVGHPHSSVQPLGFDSELIATLIPAFVPRFLARIIGRHSYGFFLQTEDGSHPDNRISERSDPALRVMDYDAERTPASQSEHRGFTRAFRRALLRLGFISFTQRIGLNGTAHVDGSLIAGTNPSDSVVDAHGAVFGIAGLYVVDGSILPRSSRVNPSLSIYAWGLRVADRLVESFKLRRGQDAP